MSSVVNIKKSIWRCRRYLSIFFSFFPSRGLAKGMSSPYSLPTFLLFFILTHPDFCCCYLFSGLFRTLFVLGLFPSRIRKLDLLHDGVWECKYFFFFFLNKSLFVEAKILMKLIIDAWCSSSRSWVYQLIKWLLQERTLGTERTRHFEVHSGDLHFHVPFCFSCLENAFCGSSICLVCHNGVTAEIFFLCTSYNMQKRKKGSIKMYNGIILSTFLLKL